MGEQGINRFQYWALRSKRRAAAVLATPTAVVLFLASIAAGLSIPTAAAVAAGIGLAVALIAALVVWAVHGGDHELHDLDVRDTRVVQRATSSVSGAVAIRSDPRLRSVAVRAARRRLRIILGLRPWAVGVYLVLAVFDVHLAVQGDWWKLAQLLAPAAIIMLLVTVPPRLRRVLDVLEAPDVSADELPDRP